MAELTCTSSLARSITNSTGESTQDYMFEHGRRYHAYQEGKYALPNDEEEIARLGVYIRYIVLTLVADLL